MSTIRSHITGSWNHAVAFVVAQFGPQTLATGSCFFWRHEDRSLLVSNGHIISGRDPRTTQPISSTGGVPDQLSFTAYQRTSEPDAEGFYELRVKTITVPLYDAHSDRGRWLEHPSLQTRVDIAALDVSDAVATESLMIHYVNELEADAIATPYASQDVFIVGYPLGLVTSVPIPVWKRGTIATDPTFDPDELPLIYVDAATRSGMSGSPVLARHVLVGGYTNKKGESIPAIYARKDIFLGVYSGRLHPDQVQIQLGIVWKRLALEATVSGGTLTRSRRP